MWICPNCGKEMARAGAHLSRCLDPLRDVEAFTAKVQRGHESECWPFMGARVPAGGYGRALFCGKLVAAHRIAYMLAKGDIPPGLDVTHDCDNPPCCNPWHLRPGTEAANMGEMAAKGRSTRGEKSYWAKLKEDEVLEIRSLKGKVPHKEIADRFGITKSYVSHIQCRVVWRHLP